MSQCAFMSHPLWRCPYCGQNQSATKPEPPTVTMLPRDQLADRLAFERAKRIVEAQGYDLVPRETLGCEGSAVLERKG